MAHARRCAHSGQSRSQDAHDDLNNGLPRLLSHRLESSFLATVVTTGVATFVAAGVSASVGATAVATSVLALAAATWVTEVLEGHQRLDADLLAVDGTHSDSLISTAMMASRPTIQLWSFRCWASPRVDSVFWRSTSA